MKLHQRRLLNVSLLVLALLVIVFIQQLNQYTLNNNAFFTGWILLVAVLVLYLFTLRKKITGGKLFLKVSTWMQLHIYVGFFVIALFLFHAGWQMPEGILKQLLYFTFVAETLSGLFGLCITRMLPPCLARNGSVLYQDIKGKQQQIFDDVEQLVEQSLEIKSNTIAAFYQEHLLHFLLKPRDFWPHLFQYKKIIYKFEAEFINLQRYLNEEECEIINKIHVLVVEKNRLDYQYAGQSLLKRWLFVHIPLSYGLLLFAVLHLILVYAYIGGL